MGGANTNTVHKFYLDNYGAVQSSFDYTFERMGKEHKRSTPSTGKIDEILDAAIKRHGLPLASDTPPPLVLPNAQCEQNLPFQELSLPSRRRYTDALEKWRELATTNSLRRQLTLGFCGPPDVPSSITKNTKEMLQEFGFCTHKHSREVGDTARGVSKILTDGIVTLYPTKQATSALGRIAYALYKKMGYPLLFSPSRLVHDGCGGQFLTHGSRDSGPGGVLVGRSELRDLLDQGKGVSSILFHEIWHAHTDFLIRVKGKAPVFCGYQTARWSSKLAYSRYMNFDEIPAWSLSLALEADALRKTTLPFLRLDLCMRVFDSSLIIARLCYKAVFSAYQAKKVVIKADISSSCPGETKSAAVSFRRLDLPSDNGSMLITQIRCGWGKTATLYLPHESFRKFELSSKTDCLEAEKKCLQESLRADILTRIDKLSTSSRSLIFPSSALALGTVFSFFPILHTQIAKYARNLNARVRELNSSPA